MLTMPPFRYADYYCCQIFTLADIDAMPPLFSLDAFDATLLRHTRCRRHAVAAALPALIVYMRMRYC